jgi:hypothetical protein
VVTSNKTCLGFNEKKNNSIVGLSCLFSVFFAVFPSLFFSSSRRPCFSARSQFYAAVPSCFSCPGVLLCGRAPRSISCFYRRFASRALDFPNRFLTPTGRSAHAQCSVKDFSIFIVLALALSLGSCCQDSRFLGQIRQGCAQAPVDM